MNLYCCFFVLTIADDFERIYKRKSGENVVVAFRWAAFVFVYVCLCVHVFVFMYANK